MANISVVIGTVYGGAQYVGEQAQSFLQEQGHEITVFDEATVDDFTAASDIILVITSTTGQGDLPPNLEGTYFELKDQFPMLTGKRYAVIALGDSSYGETYCAAGKKMDELLMELQAVRIGENLMVDAAETMEPEEDAVKWLEDWVNLI